MKKMRNLAIRLSKDEQGATAIEYGLLAALIAVAIIGVVSTLGGTLKDTFQTVSDDIKNPPAAAAGGGAGEDD